MLSSGRIALLLLAAFTMAGCAAMARSPERLPPAPTVAPSPPGPAEGGTPASIAGQEAHEPPGPCPPGHQHVVAPGETMWRIAHRYGLEPEQLARCNGIADPRRIRAGDRLVIPSSAPPPAVEPAAEGPPPSGPLPYDTGPLSPADDIEPGVIEDEFVQVDGEDEPDPWEYGAPRPRVEPGPAGQPSSPFLWPVAGAISSTFGIRGRRMHRGVDLRAAEGSSIRASRDGIVVYSGRGFRGYGNLVILDHGDGFLTVYAHNRKNLVRLNEAVRAGDTVALAGHTGNATAAHVHFEIRMGEKAVDPLSYLPSVVAASAPPEPASADTAASAR